MAVVFRVMAPRSLVDGYLQDKCLITQNTTTWVRITSHLSVAQIFRTAALTRDFSKLRHLTPARIKCPVKADEDQNFSEECRTQGII
jgi:hypothetical protein